MTTERSGIADGVQVAKDAIVGNEQWADDEGVTGPDPAWWDDVTNRVSTGFEPPELGEVKGPDPDIWGG